MNPLLLDTLYAGALLASSPYFLYRMATTGKYRAGLLQRLGFLKSRAGGECLWVHGVSVGELLAARGIVEALESAFPDNPAVISTTTNTGFEVALKSYEGRFIFYFPLDFSWAVRSAFRKVRPRAVVLMEMEVWPNFLAIARSERVPVIVANGRITEKAFRNHRRFGKFSRAMLSMVDMYLVQNDTYARRLLALGVPAERVRVTGSVKFDTLSTDLDPERRRRLREEMGVREAETLIIGGSTHEGEEAALLDAWEELAKSNPGLRLLLVPRHRTRFAAVRAAIRARGFDVFGRSELAAGGRPRGAEVLLGDTMGELEDLYEAAEIAFVGGSLIPHGGQNILEPAAKGVPVIFGPSMENFPDAAEMLLRDGAAVRISTEGELVGAIGAYLDETAVRRACDAGRKAALSMQGASAATVEAIKEVLENSVQG